MHALPPWPPLPREPSPTPETLARRIQTVARRVRAFETALEYAAEDERIDLSRHEESMAAWERAAAPVFLHTALGEGRALPADLGGLARTLDHAYEVLGRHRLALLERLGAGAGHVLEAEAGVEVDPAFLVVGQGPAGEQWDEEEHEAAHFQEPSAEQLRSLHDPGPQEHIDGEVEEGVGLLGDDELAPERAVVGVNRLTGEMPAITVEARVAAPVRADEVLKRQQAESKPLPTPANLSGLLALLPGEWITAIHKTLQLPRPDFDLSAGSRSAAMRGVIHQHLTGAGLDKVLAGLGAKERELLAALVRSPAGLVYTAVTARWGLDEADGFAWSERPPSGPVAVLRRSGLAFVGVRGPQRVVVAPADLLARMPTS